jgi:hypothetical protein
MRSTFCEMKILTMITLALGLIVFDAQAQNDNLDDQTWKAAAKKAFDSGSWNPEIFEVGEIKFRSIMLEGKIETWLPQNVLSSISKDFGKGPLTIVPYRRKPETIDKNGGETYCTLYFLVFSPTKVALVDSRAYPCPNDKTSAKTN